MGSPIYATIEGKSGKIPGGVTMKGKEDTVRVHELSHHLEQPTSHQSNSILGKRLHHPLKITKEIDKSTPPLLNALCSAEKLKKVVLKFYEPDSQGAEVVSMTITLEDVWVSDVRLMFTNLETTERAKYMEEVSFTYTKITWEHKDKTSATDSWENQ